jgi:4a-hydroxytetrahydrobiopterin dehydratase
VVWIAHNQNHHPKLVVAYGYCDVQYSTHAIDGLSENDFICAAKIDQLVTEAD